MSPSDLRASFFNRPWVRVKNASGETIPPFSVMLVTGTSISNNNVVHTVKKPADSDTTKSRTYLVNGPFAIGSGSANEGLAQTMNEPGLISFVTGNTPAIGEMYGPFDGSWVAGLNKYGYKVIGSTTTAAGVSVVPVVQVPRYVTYRFWTSGTSIANASPTTITSTSDQYFGPTGNGEFSVSSGVLNLNVYSPYTVSFSVLGTGTFTRNNSQTTRFLVQRSLNGGSTWGSFLSLSQTTSYPDVAVSDPVDEFTVSATEFSGQVNSLHSFRFVSEFTVNKGAFQAVTANYELRVRLM